MKKRMTIVVVSIIITFCVACVPEKIEATSAVNPPAMA
jgi:hypothetical protein